jgi:hypothetical protein
MHGVTGQPARDEASLGTGRRQCHARDRQVHFRQCYTKALDFRSVILKQNRLEYCNAIFFSSQCDNVFSCSVSMAGGRVELELRFAKKKRTAFSHPLPLARSINQP